MTARNTLLMLVFPLVVFAQAPLEQPTLHRPADGAVVTHHAPVLDATAPGAELVDVLIDGVVVETRSTQAGPRVVYDLSEHAPLAEGAHTWGLRVTDASGHVTEALSHFEVRPESQVGCGCQHGELLAASLGAWVVVRLRRRSRTPRVLLRAAS